MLLKPYPQWDSHQFYDLPKLSEDQKEQDSLIEKLDNYNAWRLQIFQLWEV